MLKVKHHTPKQEHNEMSIEFQNNLPDIRIRQYIRYLKIKLNKKSYGQMFDRILNVNSFDYLCSVLIKIKSKKSFPDLDGKTIIKQRQVKEKRLNPNNLEFNESCIRKKLREGLPEKFSDKSIDYLVGVLKKNWDSKIEYGQIFNPITGKPTSIEFRGEEDNVEIIPSGLVKDFEDMTPEEFNKYYTNPESNMLVTRKMEGGSFAMQHTHTRYGLYAPSGEDFFSIMSQPWTDDSIVLTQKEVWLIETSGTFDTKVRINVCENLKLRSKLRSSYATSQEREKYSKNWWSILNDSYSSDVENYINNMVQYKIKVTRVIL